MPEEPDKSIQLCQSFEIEKQTTEESEILEKRDDSLVRSSTFEPMSEFSRDLRIVSLNNSDEYSTARLREDDVASVYSFKSFADQENIEGCASSRYL